MVGLGWIFVLNKDDVFFAPSESILEVYIVICLCPLPGDHYSSYIRGTHTRELFCCAFDPKPPAVVAAGYLVVMVMKSGTRLALLF